MSVEYPIEIKNELYSRINSFFNNNIDLRDNNNNNNNEKIKHDKFNDIINAFVIVVGVGGVGSHVANMLVRSGVTHIRIIDFNIRNISY